MRLGASLHLAGRSAALGSGSTAPAHYVFSLFPADRLLLVSAVRALDIDLCVFVSLETDPL